VIEREVKLLVDPGVELPPPEELMHRLGDWTVQDIEQEATYFDTPDLRLTRSGASLRYRSDDGWTVKLPEGREGATFTRAEHGFPGEPGPPPPAAADLVRVWVRSGILGEVARIHTRRRKIRVFDDRGASVGEIDDDEVTATAPLPVQFHEVEVEMSDAADPRLVETLLQRLRDAGAGTGDSATKVARVLGDRATEPPDLAPPRPLHRDSSLADLVQACVATSVQRLFVNDPVVRIGEDPEGIHQARVATRRLRSDLRTFRPVLDTRWSEPLRTELKWLGEELGRVRDADVLLGLLEAKAADLPPIDEAPAHVLLDRLRDLRSRDRGALLEGVASARYATLLDQLVDAAAAPTMRHPDHTTRASRAVGRLAARPWKQLRKKVRRLGPVPADAELHEVRKQAKQARYAVEAIAPVAGKRAPAHAQRIAALQDVLGDHHDAVVAAAWLRDAAQDIGDPDVAFVAGVMAAAFAADQRRLRSEWRAVWRRAERRSLSRYS
jgi:CHAD domain-containing protein